MIVLGIDPGICNTGWAICEEGRVKDMGTWTAPSPHSPKEAVGNATHMAGNLLQAMPIEAAMAMKVSGMSVPPALVAIEAPTIPPGMRSTQAFRHGAVFGALFAVARLFGSGVVMVSTRLVDETLGITGKGGTRKARVADWVKSGPVPAVVHQIAGFPLPRCPKAQHAYDAAAVAVASEKVYGVC